MKAPVCRNMSRLLAQGGLETAPWHQAALLRFHLWYCFLCWPYARQLKFTHEAFRSTWTGRTDPQKVADLKRRLIARLAVQ
jgi:hypothetical protein